MVANLNAETYCDHPESTLSQAATEHLLQITDHLIPTVDFRQNCTSPTLHKQHCAEVRARQAQLALQNGKEPLELRDELTLHNPSSATQASVQRHKH